MKKKPPEKEIYKIKNACVFTGLQGRVPDGGVGRVIYHWACARSWRQNSEGSARLYHTSLQVSSISCINRRHFLVFPLFLSLLFSFFLFSFVLSFFIYTSFPSFHPIFLSVRHPSIHPPKINPSIHPSYIHTYIHVHQSIHTPFDPHTHTNMCIHPSILLSDFILWNRSRFFHVTAT